MKEDKKKTEKIEALLQRAAIILSDNESAPTNPIDGLQPYPQKPDKGRFEISELLGAGNMGKVYKAYDPTLQRHVALKFLEGDDPAQLSQFLREARAQARIEHEYICKVYEVGELQGRHYIAMQYIQGKTLQEAAQEMVLEQKIKVLQQAAEAVHAAHEMGLIHRDLKPGNIMVEKTDQQWKPYVMDFGLVREQAAPGITINGSVVGSPSYMAPEQAQGDLNKLDRRSDVYGLGATLYELLTGHPPFEGSNAAEVIVKVLQEEPKLLRKINPSLPGDLEAISMKCLEKEPHRRYDSAKALAEDLHRYLLAEPVRAQRASWYYWAFKKAKKNKITTAFAILTLFVVFLLIGLWLHTGWKASEQAQMAQQFGQEVEKVHGFLRFAYTLPLHDLRAEKSVVAERMKLIESEMEQLGDMAQGPGHYALGRSFLSLHQYQNARLHLEQAWKIGYRVTEVSYALGQVFGSLYQKGIAEAEHYHGEEQEKRKQELIQKYRQPAVNYLHSSRGIREESPAYIEGLIAFYDGKYEQGLQKAREAYRQIPGFYEAKKLEGNIYLTSAIDKKWNEQYQEAWNDLQQAGKAFEFATQIARSDESLRLAECERRYQMMEVKLNLEHAFPSEYKEVLDACDLVLKADPDNAEAYYRKSAVNHRLGEFQMNHGMQFYPTLRSSIEFGEKAVKMDPKNTSLYETIGLAYWRMGVYEVEHGLNALPSLDRAISISQTVSRISSQVEEAYGLAGLAYITKGEYLAQNGNDPSSAFQLGLESFRKANQIKPGWEPAINGIGFSLVSQAEYAIIHGQDPGLLITEAIKNYQAALRDLPKQTKTWNYLANAYLQQAKYEQTRGIDPNVTLRYSLAATEKSLEIDAQNFSAYNRQGDVYFQLAANPTASKSDSRNYLEKAINGYKKAVEINPDFPTGYRNLAKAYLLKSRTTPSDLQKAQQYLTNAKRLNPKHSENILIEQNLKLVNRNNI